MRSLVESVLVSAQLFFTLLPVSAANVGMSLGINDVIPGRNLRAQKEGKVEAAYRDCEVLIAKAKMGKLDNKPG